MIKKIHRISHYTVLLLFFISHFTFYIRQCYSAFMDVGMGGRPLGMGNAFVAVADDVNAIMYNSAGSVQVKQPEVGAMYGKLYPGIDNLNYGYLSYVHSFNEQTGNFGFGWVNFMAADLYEENTVVLSYAHQLNKIGFINRLLAGNILSAGLNMKLLSKKYYENEWTAINPVFADKTTSTGFTMDLGFLYKFNRDLNLGMSLENITQPDISIQSKSRVLSNYRFGASYRFRDYDILGTVENTYRAEECKVQAGLEKRFFRKLFASRIGFGIGSSDYLIMNVGFGFNFNMKEWAGQVDYAYLFPLKFIEENGGAHYLSFTAKIGSFNREKEKEDEKLGAEIETNFRQGKKYYKEGKCDAAIERWEEVLRMNPDHKRAAKYIQKVKKKIQEEREDETQFRQGMSYYKEGKYEEAVERWEETLKINPEHKKADKYIEKAKEKNQKERETAEDRRLKLIEKHYGKAFTSYAQGRFDKAIKECEEVLRLDPDNKKTNILIEKSREKLGQ